MADKPKIPKLPMTRRGFLGVLGTGIAAALMGGVRTAPKVAAVVPEITAKGMPSWFPMLIDKIKTQGKQIEFATGGRRPDNVYSLKVDGNEYTLTEDAVSGSMDISTRGDDYQQVSFEYIPPTDVVRPGGKVIKEDAEFYAHEFMKGQFQDYENTLSTIDDLKLGIKDIEEFAKKGNETTDDKMNKLVEDFKKATTKEEFATGGRVGYKNGGGVGTLFKEKKA